MKKIVNVFLCFLLCLGFLFPYFGTKKESQFSNALVSYDELEKTQEIIGIEKSGLSQELANDSNLYQTPFDTKTKKQMDGYSISPAVITDSNDKYRKQVHNALYSVKNFTLDENSSVFMWIYIPEDLETNLFCFSLSFLSGDGKEITWKYDDESFDNLYPIAYYANYGWVLFEFRINGASTYNAQSDTIFTQMRINYHFDFEKYELEFDYNNIIINGSLSIYDVFVGKKKSETTGIINQLSYYYYGIKSEFKQKLNSYYVNDVFTANSIGDIFSYIYVGKYNLLLYGIQNNNFTWTFTLTIAGEKNNFNFSTSNRVKFFKKGECSFNIKLEESRSSKNRTVFTTTLDFNCDEYKFGKFENGDNIIKKNTYILKFKVSDSYKLNGDIDFSSSNEKIFTIDSSYYNEEDDYYYVKIVCNKSGKANILAKSNGERIGVSSGDFSVQTELKFSKTTGILQSSFFRIILIIYAVAVVVLLVVTLINRQKAKKLK